MKRRFKNIDALRGIAAILVMIIHIYDAFIRIEDVQLASNLPQNLFEYFDIGRIGITIFFLISGFVIGRSLKSYRVHAIKTFVIRRLFRLYPLFWFSIFAAVMLKLISTGNFIDLPTLIANSTMLAAWFNKPFVLGLYWSLETELIFYFLVVVLYALTGLKNVKHNIACTVVLFAIAAVFFVFPEFRPSQAHWVATPYHLGLMFLGLTWREFYELKENRIIRHLFYSHLSLLLVVPGCFLFLFVFTGSEVNLPDSTAYLLGILIFGLGLRYWEVPQSIFIFLGKWSYSIYLLHPIVFQSFLSMYQNGKFGSIDHLVFYLILCSATTIGLSYLTYRWIEKPMILIGRNKTSEYRKD